MATVALPAPGKGVRTLSLKDQAPNCEIVINEKVYELSEIARNSKVVDIGCGYGRSREVVESVGGEWTGVEPFEGGTHTVLASAEDLPFDDDSYDVAIMDAVLEHIPDVGKAFSEVARILRPGGLFVGYVAFMECFHEISYSHLSFKALEHYSGLNGMKLVKLGGGSAFGLDYHARILVYPIPTAWLRPFVAKLIRTTFLAKSYLAYAMLRAVRRYSHDEAKDLSRLYYQVECLRQSNGFTFVIEKL